MSRNEDTQKAIRIFRDKINWTAISGKDEIKISVIDALSISDELWRLDEGNEYGAPPKE